MTLKNDKISYIREDEIGKKFYVIQKDSEGSWIIAYYEFKI